MNCHSLELIREGSVNAVLRWRCEVQLLRMGSKQLNPCPSLGMEFGSRIMSGNKRGESHSQSIACRNVELI